MPSYTVLVATLCLAAVAADLVIAVAGRKLLATAAPWPSAPAELRQVCQRAPEPGLLPLRKVRRSAELAD